MSTPKRDRSWTRHQAERVKAKTLRILKIWNRWPFFRDKLTELLSPEAIGKNASVHCRGCSCYKCKKGSWFNRNYKRERHAANE